MDNSTFAIEAQRVWCIYPISGNYTSFQRILFLLVIAFVLFGKFHECLKAAALGFAVSYSAVAAIHGLFLVFQQNPQYDGDIFAVNQIIQVAKFASILCFLFRPVLLNRNLSLLVNTWMYLLVASDLALSLTMPRLDSKITSSLIVSFCLQGEPCDDPCNNMNITTIFRGYLGDSITSIPWDNVNLANVPSPDPTGIMKMPAPSSALLIIKNMALLSMRNSLALSPALQNLNLHPKDARNRIFLRLLSQRVLKPSRTSPRWKGAPASALVFLLQARWFILNCQPVFVILDLPASILIRIISWYFGVRIPSTEELTFLEPRISRTRYLAAKYIALAWYILANLGYFLWIPVVMPLSVRNENWLETIPESESVRAIGQWGPWLTLALALASAVVSRLAELDHATEIFPIHWLQYQHYRSVYRQFVSWIMLEWKELRLWWRRPGEFVADMLKREEDDDDTEERFPSRMLLELYRLCDVEYNQLLPMSRGSERYSITRGDLCDYGVAMEARALEKAARKGRKQD